MLHQPALPARQVCKLIRNDNKKYMSKIGKIPVIISNGVTVIQQDKKISVSGSKGALSYMLPEGLALAVGDGKATVSQIKENDEKTKALFGLARSLIANMVKGVSVGFEKKLELSGVGYRAQVTGGDLTLSVGFSHPVKINAEENITFSVADNIITVAGIDKAIVGNIAAHIRAIRPPEPYKGKGIKYVGEKVRRKAGKAAKAVGGK